MLVCRIQIRTTSTWCCVYYFSFLVRLACDSALSRICKSIQDPRSFGPFHQQNSLLFFFPCSFLSNPFGARRSRRFSSFCFINPSKASRGYLLGFSNLEPSDCIFPPPISIAYVAKASQLFVTKLKSQGLCTVRRCAVVSRSSIASQSSPPPAGAHRQLGPAYVSQYEQPNSASQLKKAFRATVELRFPPRSI